MNNCAVKVSNDYCLRWSFAESIWYLSVGSFVSSSWFKRCMRLPTLLHPKLMGHHDWSLLHPFGYGHIGDVDEVFGGVVASNGIVWY